MEISIKTCCTCITAVLRCRESACALHKSCIRSGLEGLLTVTEWRVAADEREQASRIRHVKAAELYNEHEKDLPELHEQDPTVSKSSRYSPKEVYTSLIHLKDRIGLVVQKLLFRRIMWKWTDWTGLLEGFEEKYWIQSSCKQNRLIPAIRQSRQNILGSKYPLWKNLQISTNYIIPLIPNEIWYYRSMVLPYLAAFL